MSIPDNSVNTSFALYDLRSQINAMLDPAMSFNDWLAPWFPGITWWGKVLIFLAMILGIEVLIYCTIHSCCGLMSPMSLPSFSDHGKRHWFFKRWNPIFLSPLDQLGQDFGSLARQDQCSSSA